jgi:FKBP-type peptidyl-prolyl cis-trans isomerase FkpA
MHSKIAVKNRLHLLAAVATVGFAAGAVAQTPAPATTPTPAPAAVPMPPKGTAVPTPPLPTEASKAGGPPLPTPGGTQGGPPMPKAGSSTDGPPLPQASGATGGPPLPTGTGATGGPPLPAGAKVIPPPTAVPTDKNETFPDKVTTLITRDRATGTGDAVVTGQAVAVHYTGWVYDPKKPEGKGEKFDSSLTPSGGRPAIPFNFMLGAGRVIKGWDQGVVGMKPRGKRTLIIPPSLAYGDRQGLPFPPGSTLIFDVELLNVLSPPPSAAPVAAPAKAPN